MTDIDIRLANKGRREPIAGLVQQARVHLKLLETHADALDRCGFKAVKVDRLKTKTAELDTDAARAHDARGGSKAKTAAEQTAIDEGKALLRLVYNARVPALRDTPVEGVTPDSFNVGKTLGRSTAEISAHFGRIQGPAQKADEAFKPYFNGEKLSEKIKAAKEKLDNANATQETALSALPLETQKIYETKGAVLELIEDMNRAGWSAFDGNATMVGLFNKDVLLRARKAAKKEKDAPEPPVPGTPG